MKQKLKTDIGNKRKKNKNIAFGRKCFGSGEKGKHDKYANDNLLRKTKHLILYNLIEFINETFRNIYKENIGNGLLIKKLFIMKQDQIVNTCINYNQRFLNKSLKDIFSEDICKNITNFPLKHNKNLIYKLMNENDKYKKILFNKIFNLRFKEVIRHINGNGEIEELKGLKHIDDILKKYKDDPDYFDVLKYYILNFEEIMERKRTKKTKIR